MLMSLLILIPVLSSVFIYKLPKKVSLVLLWCIQLFLLINVYQFFIHSSMNQPLLEVLGGNDPVLYISLMGNRLSFALLALNTVVFSLIHLFSVKEEFYNNKFMMLCTVLQAVVNGLFLTNDIFNLFVLFELSTVVLTLLVIFQKTKESIYNAIYFIVVQVLSMLFFLFGIAYIYRIFGVLAIDVIASRMIYVDATSLILPASFMFAGIAVKLGFFPLFSWVRVTYKAVSNPFAVQAIQSGIFIKVSIFVFARTFNMFSQTIDFTNILLVLALLTGIITTIKALSQKNPLVMLAFSTISQVSLICVGIILGGIGFEGGMLHAINHGFFKILLFLSFGIVAKNYLTSDINEIRGVFKNMPFVGVMILIGLLSVTGFPFFNGYLSKAMIQSASNAQWVTIALYLINMGTFLYSVKFAKVLFGKSDIQTKPINIFQVISLSLIAIIIIASGIFGENLLHYLFNVTYTMTSNMHIEKLVTYVVMLAIAILAHKFVPVKEDFYKRISGSLTLAHTTFMLLIFFTILMAYGYLAG